MPRSKKAKKDKSEITSLGEVSYVIDKIVKDIQHGTFERSLSGLTALAATITTAEIFFEHYRASFGNKWMWSPIIVTPPVVVAGVMGVFSRKWAKTVLPVTAIIYTADGLLGEYFHARGVARKPGGWKLASYNVPMGPPIAAPGLMTLVGGMGLLAAILPTRRRTSLVRDLSRPDHLPHLREDGEPRESSWLPRQRRGITPQMIGRYPDFDVFDAADTWDPATTKVITERMEVGGNFAFFTVHEQPTLRAFCDVAVAQDQEPRIPVPELVDEKLAAGRLDGYQYADMPDDRETWRLALTGLDEVAAARHEQRFAELDLANQESIIEAFSKGWLTSESLDGINVSRAWAVCMRMILAAFYSHPWAWNEIGFGGPAYPRGFMRLGPTSTREPFEKTGATDEDPVRIVAEGAE